MYAIQQDMSGVSVLDMTSVWDDLLKRKSYWDLSENGINHPNDFGQWLYVIALSELLAQ